MKKVSVILKAIPQFGYEFVEWTGGFNSTSDSVSVYLTGNMDITAVFSETGSTPSSIVINEINYNSSIDFNPDDWVEIYNNSNTGQDLSGWIFKDEDDTHSFVLPQDFVLLPDEYYVLCKDTLAFHSLFPDVENYLGNFNFGLSGNGELIRLYDNIGVIVDSLIYDDQLPWPIEPDGNGPTLSLKNPGMNNILYQNWAASGEHGTPGIINDVYVSAENDIPETPNRLILNPNFPNPFNPSTTIKYSLPLDSQVKLVIYNLKGQLTKLIVDEFQTKGEHSASWDGTDVNGKLVASGIYFYQLGSGKVKVNRKMVLLK